MGLDPAIYLAACFEPPTTPLGFDELTIAGGLRRRPVELVDCVSVAAKAIARAEIVLEGEILPGERIREDAQTEHRLLHARVPRLPRQGAAGAAGDPRHGRHAPAQSDPADHHRARARST